MKKLAEIRLPEKSKKRHKIVFFINNKKGATGSFFIVLNKV